MPRRAGEDRGVAHSQDDPRPAGETGLAFTCLSRRRLWERELPISDRRFPVRTCRSSGNRRSVIGGRKSDNSRSFLRQEALQFFGQMLSELVAEDGGVEPVERQVATVHQVDQGVEHLGLVTDLVAEAEVLVALDETDRLHVLHRPILPRPRGAIAGAPPRRTHTLSSLPANPVGTRLALPERHATPHLVVARIPPSSSAVSEW